MRPFATRLLDGKRILITGLGTSRITRCSESTSNSPLCEGP